VLELVSTNDRRMPNHDELTGTRRRWLLLIQQLPTEPSSARIKTWRRLQQLGSVNLKNSVYVLPHTAQAREDFEWLATEIRAANGQASVLAAEALTSEQETEICEAFRRARSADYEALRGKAHDLLRKTPARVAGAARQHLQRSLWTFRDELARVRALDFCGAPARAAAEEALEALTAKLRTGSPRIPAAAAALLRPEQYQRRVWVTRPGPGVDRMASAWLIQRFIDPAARFAFTDADTATLPKRDIPFDMYGAEFGHQADRCSFETLCERFGIDDPAVQQIAAIVHDVDLKDRRYQPPEAPVIGGLIEGLQATYQDDHALLQHGMALFAGLYESFARSSAGSRRRPRRSKTAARTPRRRP
jgi:hypothetical protein